MTIDNESNVFIGTPVASSVSNELDYHGTFLGTPRLPEERNAEYKKRLLDVYVHRANSSYTGLINGITRELGLKFFYPIELNIKPNLNSEWSPRIEFKDNVTYIWKDSLTQLLDKKIEHGDSKLPTYFINGFIDEVNSSSTFNATLLNPEYAYKRTDCIVNQSSSKLVVTQTLLSLKTNYLGVPFIDRGSLVFNNREVFKTEVNSLNLVNSKGKFYIDYTAGRIHSFDLPRQDTVIQYSFRQENFQPVASPVIIRPIHSSEFQTIMFNQSPQIDNTTTSSTPSDKGASIINELLSVVPTYWGL